MSEKVWLPVWMVLLLGLIYVGTIATLAAQTGHKAVAEVLARKNFYLVEWVKNKTDYDTACRVNSWAEERAIKDLLNE